MKNVEIISKTDVLNNGVLFDGDLVDYESITACLLCDSSSGNQIPITGLVYELYSNGNLDYYCNYENGLKNGDYVMFFEDGKIKSFVTMYQGVSHGTEIHWHRNGNMKSESITKYGYDMAKRVWNESGELIAETTEPNDLAKAMIEKYEKLRGRANNA